MRPSRASVKSILVGAALFSLAALTFSHAQEQMAQPVAPPAQEPAPAQQQPANPGGPAAPQQNAQGNTGDADEIDLPAVIALPTPVPQTKIEQLLGKTNVIVVKGFTESGSTPGEVGTGVRVYAVEIKAGDTDKALGAAIEVHQGSKVAVSYVDVEDLGALVTAFSDLSKLEHNASGLDHYEATFRTKGNLEITSRMFDGNRAFLVRTSQVSASQGTFSRATAVFTPSTFTLLRQQLNNALETLNRIP